MKEDKYLQIMRNLKDLFDRLPKGGKKNLADKLYLDKSMFSKYGKTEIPTLVTFALICEELNIDPNEILCIPLDKDLPDNKNKPE